MTKKLHKDNPWMTTGILKSINAKDKLYKVLKQTSKESPNYADIQTNFKTYRNIIRRSIMFAKRDYYQRMFNTFSNDMKKTWQTINDTSARPEVRGTADVGWRSLFPLPINPPRTHSRLYHHMCLRTDGRWRT